MTLKRQKQGNKSEKPPEDNVRYQFKHLHTPKPEKHHCYPHTLCQFNNRQKEHSFQDHHNPAPTDTNTILTFQYLTDNNHCQYPVHHRDQTSLKDIQSASTIFLPVFVMTLYRPLHKPSSKSCSMSDTVLTTDMEYTYILGAKTSEEPIQMKTKYFLHNKNTDIH